MRAAFRVHRRPGRASGPRVTPECACSKRLLQPSLAEDSTSLARTWLLRATRRPDPASSPRADVCRVSLIRGTWRQGWETIAYGASYLRSHFGKALPPAHLYVH